MDVFSSKWWNNGYKMYQECENMAYEWRFYMVENMAYLELNIPPHSLVCMSSCKYNTYILYLIIDFRDFVSLCRCRFLWINALFHLILSHIFNLIYFTIEKWKLRTSERWDGGWYDNMNTDLGVCILCSWIVDGD